MGLGHVPGVFRRSVVWTECQVFADVSSAFIQVTTKPVWSEPEKHCPVIFLSDF
ncbi:unnamed protein product [Gulo gulo]|uniref:Uncharacterized protein n=1 Tax=Gulo gulo TaxID=48420 RepID=A0A9X9Q7I3_GULGU|nr:unnamed protein product [Gulo gulo]